MESIEPKKAAIIRILQILQHYSDIDHPLKHEEIVSILERDYGIIVERKAIGRNISILNEVGYEIETTRKGSYLAERTFEDAELKLLIDGVLSSKHVTAKHSKELIEKLSALSNKYFKSSIKNVYSVGEWGKTENPALFYNIEIIDEAIASGKKITFHYNKYGADKKLHCSAVHIVSPYQLLLKNQRYYVMAFQEKWKHIRYYRLDRITEIAPLEESVTPLRSIAGFESGIDYRKISSALPYMYSDEPEVVEFLADEIILDQIVDWFGYDFHIEKVGERYLIRLLVSINAMEYWAMQYLNSVEILSPISLRNKIKENLKQATQRYADEKV